MPQILDKIIHNRAHRPQNWGICYVLDIGASRPSAGDFVISAPRFLKSTTTKTNSSGLKLYQLKQITQPPKKTKLELKDEDLNV